MESSNDSPVCYHCKVRTTGKICYRGESLTSSQEPELPREDSFLKRLREPAHSAYMRLMQLKTLVSSTFYDIVNHFIPRKGVSEADIANQIRSQLQYADFPDHVLRCGLCHCFFCSTVVCHCPSCLDGEESHYVILMHGVLVSPLMMADCSKALFDRFPTLFVYFPVSVCGKTLHGTTYVLNLLVKELGTLFSKLPKQFKLSLIGHSYGGILLRYFLVHYHMTDGALLKDQPKGDKKAKEQPEESKQKITWKNLICIATPHAGIYENNVEFRKLISLLGSKTINQLENETIDLLFLLKEDGFLDQLENVTIYGNISGDIMVAPRTSIILPNHLYSEKKLASLYQLLTKTPGHPLSIVSDLVVDFINEEPEAEESSDSDSDDSTESDENVDSVCDEFVERFGNLVKSKLENTKDLEFILRLNRSYKRTLSGASSQPNSPKRLKSMDGDSPRSRASEEGQAPAPRADKGGEYLAELFGEKDLAKFREVISDIVRSSGPKLIRAFRGDDGFFYNEVLLTLLYRLRASKFAVYIPRIHIPHRSIVAYQATGAQEHYTDIILTHLVHSFAI